MPSRSFGKKSRHGCDRCKKRHVKCDEAIPCNHCLRRNEHCSLLDTRPDSTHSLPNRNIHISQGLSPLSPFSGSPNHPESSTWALDLHLMSHFTSHTVYTFSSYPTLINAWQTTIIRDAVSQPFLLHGILAISALHLASKPRDPEAGENEIAPHNYVRAFRHHQNEAIPQYRNVLQSLDVVDDHEFAARSREPWPTGPVFAMAVLTGITATTNVSDNSLSLYSSDEDEHAEDGTAVASGATSPARSPSAEAARLDALFDRLLSIFVSIRGIRAVVRAAQEEQFFRGTVYRHLMGPYIQTDHLPAAPLGPQFFAWYDTLRTECLNDLISPGAKGDSDRAVCTLAISSLQEVHDGASRLLEVKRERLGHVQRDGVLRYDIGWFLKWTAIVSQEFLSLVREKHEAALVVLAQFASICGLAEDEWFMKNWVKNAIAAIRHMLCPGKGMRWVERIVHQWVNKEIGLDMIQT